MMLLAVVCINPLKPPDAVSPRVPVYALGMLLERAGNEVDPTVCKVDAVVLEIGDAFANAVVTTELNCDITPRLLYEARLVIRLALAARP